MGFNAYMQSYDKFRGRICKGFVLACSLMIRFGIGYTGYATPENNMRISFGVACARDSMPACDIMIKFGRNCRGYVQAYDIRFGG